MPSANHEALRFIEQLRAPQEPLASILRIHLLIEETLNEILARSVSSPDALAGARFTTAQKIALTEALYGHKRSATVWDNLRALNKLRNEVAHNLEPTQLAQRADRVVRDIMSTDYSSEVIQTASPEQQLRFAGAALLGEIAGLRPAE